MITGRDCHSCERVNKFVFNSYNQFRSQSNNESSDNFLKVCDSHFCTTELEDACSPLSIASSRGRRSSEESSATTLMKYYDGTASETPVSLASPTLPFDAFKANGKYVSKVLIRLQSKTPQPKSLEQQASPDIDIDSGRSSATESMSEADTYLAWPARLVSENRLEVYGGSPSIRVECIKTEPAPPPPFSECHGVLSSMCLSSAKLPLPVPSGLLSRNQTSCLEENVREEKTEALHLEYPICEDCENSTIRETESSHFEAKPFYMHSQNSGTSDSQVSSLELPTSAFAENIYPPPLKARVKRGMNAFASASKIQLYSSGCYLTSPLHVSGSQTVNHSGSNSIESHCQTKTQPVDDKSQKSTNPKLRGLTSGLAIREDEKVERHGTPGRNDSNGTPTLGQSIQLRRLRGQQEVTGTRTFKRSDGFDHCPTTPDGDSPSSAIEYQLLDVASKMAIRKFTHLALPITGPNGPLSSKVGMRSLNPASDLSSSQNKMTKMFVGSLQLVSEVPGILPFERACLSLLPFWHGDEGGILSTYQVPPRRYSLRVSGGRASRLQNQKGLLHRSHEKPALTPDLEGTSISVAPQSDGSPVRANVAVTCRAASENKCRWTAAPKIRRGSHVFVSDLWPEIIQRRDCEGNSAGCLQGYSCKLFSLDSEKQEASERLVGVKATGALPAVQRQFMVDATGVVDSTLTPEITERYENARIVTNK
ncbi:hypothetical protein AAHC03_0701 [Spirometra sp. Aus1]